MEKINPRQAKLDAVSQQGDRTIRPAEMLVTVARANKMTSIAGQARGGCPRGGPRQCAPAAHQIDGRGPDPWTLPRRFSRGPAEPQAGAAAGADRRPVAAEAAGAQQTTKSGSPPRCDCCTPTCT